MNLSDQVKALRAKAIRRMVLHAFFACWIYFLLHSSPISTSPWRDIRGYLFFLGLAIWRLVVWQRRFVLLKRFPVYLQALANCPQATTRELANRLSISKKKLLRDAQYFSRVGLLPMVSAEINGAFTLIDNRQHPAYNWLSKLYTQQRVAQRLQNKKQASQLPIKCPSCGAPAMVSKGKCTPCPYCGTGLKASK